MCPSAVKFTRAWLDIYLKMHLWCGTPIFQLNSISTEKSSQIMSLRFFKLLVAVLLPC